MSEFLRVGGSGHRSAVVAVRCLVGGWLVSWSRWLVDWLVGLVGELA